MSGDAESLAPSSSRLFEKINFFISGDVPENVLDLLRNGGAERMNYFTDYVTHLICGNNAEETDISDANELYDIPALTPKWIIMCVKLNRILNTKPYLYDNKKLFSNLVFCLSKVSDDRNVIWSLITYNGGDVQLQLTKHCTHLVTIDTTSVKYAKAVTCNIVLITPDWVVECVKRKTLILHDVYHPRLVNVPKPLKPENTNTRTITGFEPDNEDKTEADSTVATQALLEKLKQRMPWNQALTSIIKDIVPPNIIAPTFTAPRLPVTATTQATVVQQRTPPKVTAPQPQVYTSTTTPVARSIVHHTAQGTLIGQPPPQLTQFNQTQPNQIQATHLQRFQLQQQQQQRATLLSHITQQQQQQQQQQQIRMGQAQFSSPQLMQRQMQVTPQMQQQVANQMQLQQGSGPVNQIGQPQLGQMQRPPMPLGKNLNIQQLQQQLANRQFANVQQQQQQQPQPQSNFPPNQQLINQPPQVINQNQQQQMIINQSQLGAILNQEQLNRSQLEQIQNQQQLSVISQQNQTPQLQQQQQQQPPQQVLVQNHPHLTIQQGKILQGPFVQQAQPTDAQQFVHQFTPNQTYQQQPQIIQNPFVPNRPQSQFSAQAVIGQQQVVLNQQKPMIISQQGQPPQNQPKPIWQQQQQQQPQQQPQPQLGIRHSIIQQGPRLQWSPTQQQQQQHLPQRQFIQLDIQTHQQLQQMAPEQRAIFIGKLQQKQRQVMLQQRQQQLQMQQRTGHVLIRSGPVPQGLNPQQQMQWLQQQAKQQGVMLQPPPQQQQQQQQQPPQPQPQSQPNPPPPPATPNIPHTPGLSPIQQQNPPQFNSDNQLQLQRQQQFRLQQLQLQREQAQKVASMPQTITQTNIIRPIGQPQTADIITTTTTTNNVDASVAQQQLVVNAKTKTALANMLSIRLQSSGTTVVGTSPENLPEPSAAGTLRLMTAQHNAALNSGNRPQEILGLPQRRPITAPNGELIRPAPPPSAPPPPTLPSSEPPQLQFASRNSIPIQHRQGPFYGHNPNLKLPPDLFLLGCIFVVVELDRFLEESIPNWQEQIEKHGGEVEKQYCTRVTHVLCETQRHGVVMQALRDCKRCVTLYWLSDVMRQKQVLPPWTALHLPMMYLDTTPASKHLISLSGFINSERNRVKHMIKYIGATFTNYLSKHNTLLIAAKADGPKYAHAKKWTTPVVNVQWLTDVMLGNFTALNQLEHIKYQQFPNPPLFNFEPSLVPSLMHAWKMPINISQESYERVKRSPSPVLLPKKLKKIKVEEVEAMDEALPSLTHRVLLSLFPDLTDLKNMISELGGSVAQSHYDCTHLVMPYLGRTNKLLHCICLGIPILPESWLRDSHAAHKFLDPSNYSLDTKDFNSEYKCDFNQTLMTRNRNKLFEGKFFYITPSVFPSKKILTEIIENCGGCVEKHRRTLSQIEATNMNSPYSYIILTHANDLHLVYDVLRNKKDKIRTVCNVELIYSAILKQTFEIEPYSVQVCEVRR